jgi:hypothetical protein
LPARHPRSQHSHSFHLEREFGHPLLCEIEGQTCCYLQGHMMYIWRLTLARVSFIESEQLQGFPKSSLNLRFEKDRVALYVERDRGSLNEFSHDSPTPLSNYAPSMAHIAASASVRNYHTSLPVALSWARSFQTNSCDHKSNFPREGRHATAEREQESRPNQSNHPFR